MPTVFINIADLLVSFTSDSEKLLSEIRSKYSAYLLPNREKNQPDLQIELREGNNSIKHTKSKLVITCRSIDEYLLWFNDAIRAYLIASFHTYNGLVLHASSVVINQRAFIFLGKENTGKSTKRMQLSQFPSLGDDVALVKMENNEPFLYGSPFYQKTKINYPNEKFESPFFCFLEQSKLNMIVSVENPLSRLSSCVFLVSQNVYKNAFNLIVTFAANNKYFLYKNSLDSDPSPLLVSLVDICQRKQFSLKSINQLITDKYEVGLTAFGSIMISSLKHLSLINGLSWKFECGNDLSVVAVAEMILYKDNWSSPHKLQVDYFRHNQSKINFIDSPLILKEISNNSYEILDGNHRAIAVYLQYIKNGVDSAIPFLLVNLTER